MMGGIRSGTPPPRFSCRLMKYKLLLWDFDGTLANTLTLALNLYNRMAKEKQFKPITDPYAVREMNMREFLKSHDVPIYRVPFAFAAFLKELGKLAASVSLNEGIGEALLQISAMGIQQGVVSSNATENIQQCLQSNNAETHFAYISGTSRIFGKERRLKSAARQFKVQASEVLYIGDEIRDIEASQAAGMDVAAVSWGLNSAEALANHHPTHLVSHPNELLQILRNSQCGGERQL